MALAPVPIPGQLLVASHHLDRERCIGRIAFEYHAVSDEIGDSSGQTELLRGDCFRKLAQVASSNARCLALSE